MVENRNFAIEQNADKVQPTQNEMVEMLVAIHLKQMKLEEKQDASLTAIDIENCITVENKYKILEDIKLELIDAVSISNKANMAIENLDISVPATTERRFAVTLPIECIYSDDEDFEAYADLAIYTESEIRDISFLDDSDITVLLDDMSLGCVDADVNVNGSWVEIK